MATLRAPVVGSSNVLLMDGPVTVISEYPGRYTLESEVVYVTGGSGTADLSVDRGGDNTLPVEHATGTELVVAPVPAGTLVHQTGDTAPFPIFIGNVDPTVDPATADLVVAGSQWVDTTVGPPFAVKTASFDGASFDAWLDSQIVGYGGSGQVVQVLATSSGTLDVVTSADGLTFYHLTLYGPGASGAGGVSGFVIDAPIVATGLPTADPGVAGAIYSDGVPAAGVPKPLMISGGAAA